MDDDQVKLARAFMRWRDGDRRPIRLRDRQAFALMEQALAIFERAERAFRSRLEAYLLTGESFEMVGQRCGVEPDVAESFHDFFFEVRPRLKAGDWIISQAIRCGPWNCFAGDEVYGVWKHMARAIGPIGLEIYIAASQNEPFPAWVREALKLSPADEVDLRLRVKLAAAVMTAKSAEELLPLLDIYIKLPRLNRPRSSESDLSKARLQIMRRVLRLAARQPSNSHKLMNGRRESETTDESVASRQGRSMLQKLLSDYHQTGVPR